MTTESIIIALSALLSPLIAILISETFIRKRNLVDNQKKEILYSLMANRYKADTPEFLRAFNSIIVFWGNGDNIKKLVFQFKNATSDEKTPTLVEIIYQLCIIERIKGLSREDILSVFLKTSK
ncbi:hypothetical protein MUP35_04635 [Patescibacteria group bacterium]|nr:hypothetical protein [Patescibacteria group bacterium]